MAAETARTARAAGLRAIRIADDHWRAAGPMQARPASRFTGLLSSSRERCLPPLFLDSTLSSIV